MRSDRQSRPAGVKVDRSGSNVVRAKRFYSAVEHRDEMASRDGRRAVRIECHVDTARQCPVAIGTRAAVPARVLRVGCGRLLHTRVPQHALSTVLAIHERGQDAARRGAFATCTSTAGDRVASAYIAMQHPWDKIATALPEPGRQCYTDAFWRLWFSAS